MEINNRPSPFVLVKTGSGIFSPTVPLVGLKNWLPHQYQRLSSLRKEPVILDDYIFPVPLAVIMAAKNSYLAVKSAAPSTFLLNKLFLINSLLIGMIFALY